MSKRPSSGTMPPAKKLHSFFTQPAGAVSRGTFDESIPSMVHYVHGDPLATNPGKPVPVMFYDLDGTLIKPKSGLKWPKGSDDWVWWHDSVPGRLKEDIKEGRHVVVLSNQGHKAAKTRREWRGKLPLIAEKLGDKVPFRVLAALEKDVYRKPRTGMFDYVVKLYREKGFEVDIANSVYVGDACGRPGDHNNTDYTMALNAGLAFVTPEEHFLGRKVKYPHPPKAFRPSDLKNLNDLPLIVPSNKPIPRDTLECVIFVGPPASGKTSFYRRHFSNYAHVNQDKLKSKDACLRVARDHLSNGKSVVVDNTNRDRATRASWSKLTKELGVPMRVFYFACPIELAEHNSAYRAFYGPANEDKRDILPGSAFSTYRAQFQQPDKSEGFEELRTVNFGWNGTDAQRKLWDQYLD